MNILILGGSGYLGRHVKEKLHCPQNKLFIMQHNKISETEDGIFLIHNSEYEIETLFEQNSIDWIINCMGVYQQDGISKMLEGNFRIPFLILDRAFQCGVKNVININTSLSKEVNLYSFIKRELGQVGQFYSYHYQINFYNILLEMFYGPDEPDTRFLSSVICKMLKNEEIQLTEGKQYRDFIHIEDVCRAIEILMDSKLQGYRDIPLGSGEKHTIRETIEFLYDKLSSRSRLLFGAIEMRKYEADHVADMTIMRKLGFNNEYTWERGLMEMINNAKGN